MAELQLTDIGHATFTAVGVIANLRTASKNVVDAINELQENGGNSSSGFSFEQIYVDGENNMIIGENNIV